MVQFSQLRQQTSFLALTLLLTTTTPIALSSQTSIALAQTPTSEFPLPSSVPQGATVRIQSSSGMSALTLALKQGFEQQFSGTQVAIDNQPAEAALQAVVDGQADLAAISRPLTAAEKAQGLVAVPAKREKIAVVVGADSGFKGQLSGDQFAQIFRGDVTDWAKVGGPAAAIRLVDQPEASDTRRSFQEYPVFQSAAFQSATNATKLADVNPETLVKELRNDGVGYALVSQVRNLPGVRIVEMHGTPPTDPRYPFSQAFSYVYQGEPSPAVQAFLGYATNKPGQDAIAQVPIDAVTAAGLVAAAPPAAAPGSSPVPGGNAPAAGAAPNAAPDAAAPNADTGNAAGNTAGDAAGTGALDNTAGAGAAGDTAGGTASGGAAPVPGLPAWVSGGVGDLTSGLGGVPSWLWWLLLPLGLLGLLGCWYGGKKRKPDATIDRPGTGRANLDPASGATAHSAIDPGTSSVTASGTLPERSLSGITPGIAAGAAGVAAAGAALLSGRSRLTLEPRSPQYAYARWQVPDSDQDALRRLGGRHMSLRLFDVTGINPNQHLTTPVQEFPCHETAQDYHLPIPAADRDYVVELGYTTDDNRWLELARSQAVQIPSRVSGSVAVADGAAAMGAATGVATAARATAATQNRRDSLVLVPHPPEEAYIHWHVSAERLAAARRQGGQKLMVRLYDVTGVDLRQGGRPHSATQYECDPTLSSQPVPVPKRDRDYIAELGYLTPEKQWLRLARSLITRIPTEWNPAIDRQSSVPR